MHRASAKPKYRKVFSQAEDDQLASLVAQFGAGRWDRVAWSMPNRTPRQCRDRWNYYVCPSVNLTPWTAGEDRMLVQKVREFGCQWSVIRQFFNDRTLNNITNRWNSVIRKVKASHLNETSEHDFLHCAKLITQQYADDPSSDRPPPDPSNVFRIANLLNHRSAAIAADAGEFGFRQQPRECGSIKC
jgi:hypothetical protein